MGIKKITLNELRSIVKQIINEEKKIGKGRIYKIYKVDDPIKYNNSILYYYFNLDGSYVKRVGDFGKGVSEHKISEDELLNSDYKIWDKYYKVEFSNGESLSFIENEEEAVNISNIYSKNNL